MSWLSGWRYRRAITITEQSGSTLTDYQVKIELNSTNFDFSKANADGSDIRFTEDDGETLLPYWIEEWDATNQQAVIWVKVPSIPVNGETTIYLYYGNPSAESESDANAVFDLFDDFEDNDISDWTVLNGGFSASNGIVSTTGERNLMHKGIIAEKGIIIETSARASSDGIPGCAFAIQDVDNYYMARINEPADKLELVKKDAGNYKTVAEVQKTINADVWYVIKTVWKSNGTVRMEVYGETSERIGFDYENLNLVGTLDYTTATKWSSGYVGLRCYKAGSYDWVRVRKYAEQEPTANVGSEEIAPTVARAWDGSQWKDIKNIYYWDGSSWVKAKGAYYWDGSQWVQFWSPPPFGTVLREATTPHTRPDGIGGDSNVIWHCDYDAEKVYELSTTDFSVVRSTSSPSSGPSGIGGDSNVIWHCDSDTDKVYELSTTDFSVVRSASSPYGFPSDIGGDSNVIWHCDYDADKVYELSTTDFSVVRSASSPYVSPTGIGGDTNVIWHCDYATEKVYELSTG